MTGDEAIKALKERTGLEVSPHSVVAAIQAQPGDVEAAVKQVIDWWASGEARSKKAGTLLLAALRSQAHRVHRDRKTDWAPLIAEAQRILPSEPVPFVVGAIQTLRYSGQPVTAASVRARLQEQGRTRAQLEARAA